MADEQSTPQPPEPEPMTRERAIELVRTDVKAWNKWRDENPGVELPELRDAHLEKARLRSAHLEGAKLSYAHLEGANLSHAHLEGAKLWGAHFEGAFLWGAHFEGSTLFDAHFEGAVLNKAHLPGANLWNARLGRASLCQANLDGADLHDAHLEGADLSDAHLEGANLCNAHLEGADLRGADFSNANVTGMTYDRKRSKFRGIRVATCNGHPVFVRDARDEDYIETFRAQSPFLWVFWAFFTDCGRSLLRVGLMGASLAVFFGWAYENNPTLLDMSGSANTPWTPYYYSIVTFTTLGFGDVTPATFEGELWVGAEVLSGYLMLGLLVSILANKVARRA